MGALIAGARATVGRWVGEQGGRLEKALDVTSDALRP